jgi:hypothetical protein
LCFGMQLFNVVKVQLTSCKYDFLYLYISVIQGACVEKEQAFVGRDATT